ncbi:MAG: hypothetical protein LBC56_07545 [Oscillospiraceae bacterium]|jgi:hypothetical protein|nr:hypothetical protein [Oscillospiraceae bacterium]
MLYTIVVWGDKKENLFSKNLARALALLGKTVLINDAVTELGAENAAGTEFVIFDTDNISAINSSSAIVAVKDRTDESFANWKGLASPLLINSENTNGLSLLVNHEIAAITCGLSTKDSITLSSCAEGRAVISVQRFIKKLNGEIFEPMEYPLALGGIPIYHSLALFGILLLCGIEQEFGRPELVFRAKIL